MLSGLPIVYRTPVRAILVSEHYRASLGKATCDYSSKYLPRTFPIRGFYNDYGRLEDLQDDVFKRLWVQGLHTDMFELAVGENPCHDIAVTRDMDFDQLWEAIWEERLIVPGHWCYGEEDRQGKEGPLTVSKFEELANNTPFKIRNVRVQVAMIREDVWQTMMVYPFRSWRGDFPTSLEALKSLVREYWTECQGMLAAATPREELTTAEMMSSAILRGTDIYSIRSTIQGSSSLHSSDHYLASCIRDECGLGLGSHWLMALEGAIKPEELVEFLTGVSEMVWFELVNNFRGRGNLWKPSYAGGQNRPWKSWLRYHQDMVGILEGIITRAKADDYDDEDD
jgi:hypothetical protein